MVRTIVTPDKKIISLAIPENYIGKEIEVIAFAKDEALTNEPYTRKAVSFNALALDTRGFKFNRDDANER